MQADLVFGKEKALKDLEDNILFGPGLTYYEIEYSTGSKHTIPPHNFLLEYGLGFGMSGLILSMIAIFGPVFITVVQRIREIDYRYPCSFTFYFSHWSQLFFPTVILESTSDDSNLLYFIDTYLYYSC